MIIIRHCLIVDVQIFKLVSQILMLMRLRKDTKLKINENYITQKTRNIIYDKEYSSFYEISFAGLSTHDYREIIEDKVMILS